MVVKVPCHDQFIRLAKCGCRFKRLRPASYLLMALCPRLLRLLAHALMREPDKVNEMRISGAFCYHLLRLHGSRSGTERATELGQHRDKQIELQRHIVHQTVIDKTLLQQFSQIVVWQVQEFHRPGRYDSVPAAGWMHSIDALKASVVEHFLQRWRAWGKRHLG